MYILDLEKYSPCKSILYLEKYNPCKYILQLEKYSPCKCILHLEKYNPCKDILQFGKYTHTNISWNLEKYNPCQYIFQFGKIQFAQIYFPIWSIPTGKAAVVSRREQLTSVWGTCWQPRHHKMHKSTSNPHQHPEIHFKVTSIDAKTWLAIYEIRFGPGLFGQIHSPPLLRIGLIDMYWAMGEVERNIRPLSRGLDRMGHLADGPALRFE